MPDELVRGCCNLGCLLCSHFHASSVTYCVLCRACVVKCCCVDFKSVLRVLIVVKRTSRSVMRNRRQFVNLTVW